MAKTKCQQNSSNELSNVESCSLLSVTGLSSDSMSYTVSLSKADVSHSHSNSSSSSSSNSSSNCSSSSSSNCDSSSLTYSSNASNSTTVTKTSVDTCSTVVSSVVNPEVSSESCKDCKKSECSMGNVKCEKNNNDVCKQLVKQYRKSKDLIRANNDIIILLEFIKNKLVAVKPNIDLRHLQNYKIQENINWLETFVDTLFCVLRKNDAYKSIKVKDCKVKNASVDKVSDRLYLVKAKFNNNGHIECKTVQLNFNWSRLTFNDSKSFKGILDYTITEITNEITMLKSENTQPFLQV